MNLIVGIRARMGALALLAALTMSGAALAQAAGPVKISNAVFQQVEVKAADGSVSTKLVPAAKVVPGNEVVYEITYANTGADSATGVVVDNPVPKQLVFVGVGDVPATSVTVDDGASYGDLSTLTVTGEDGNPRAAQTSDVTNLRWELSALQPGQEGKLSFRARVK